MKKLLAIVLALVMVLSLTACAQKTETQDPQPAQTETSETAPAEEAKTEEPAAEEAKTEEAPAETHSIVYLTQTLGDMGFLDNLWEGIQALAADKGYTAQAIEMGADASVYEAGFIDALDSGKYDVFITIAIAGLDDIMSTYAPEYPEYKFILADVGRTFEAPSDNMVGISYRQNEGSFLGGVLAASLSTTGKIGVYLHGDYPVLNDFATGFYQGASTVNPDIKIFTAYGAGVSGDSPRAAELTKIMFNNGADVVYGAAGSANPGLFQNVIDLGGFEKGYYAIGVDYDQWQTYKNSNSPEMADVIISSVVKKAGDSVVTAWSKLESGEASWGDTLMFGLAEGSVGLAENEYYLECTPADVQETVNEYKEKVSSGEIAVKSYFDFASHDEFLAYQAQFAG